MNSRLSNGPSNAEVNSPILVTGTHRSGSTWLGKMLALSPQVGYIDEPFRLNTRSGIFASRFQQWFYYVSDHNAELHQANLKKTLSFRYSFWAECRSLRSAKDVARMMRDMTLWWQARRASLRPLMKDPIAFFSAPFIYRAFDASVVVAIRHPCAFVSSLCDAGWDFDFHDFLNQPELMRDYLHDFREEIERFANQPPPLLDQAILLWRIFHHTIRRFEQEFPDWVFVKHETLAQHPVSEFKKLYECLNIEFSPEIEQQILQYSNAANPIDNHDQKHEIKRDSKKLIAKWKQRLSADEIKRVRDQCEELARHFYTDSDW